MLPNAKRTLIIITANFIRLDGENMKILPEVLLVSLPVKNVKLFIKTFVSPQS